MRVHCLPHTVGDHYQRASIAFSEPTSRDPLILRVFHAPCQLDNGPLVRDVTNATRSAAK